MRTGEVFALTWDDIDLNNKVINVNKTVYSKLKDNKGRWYLGTTKTEGSRYKKYYLEAIKNKYSKIVEY